MKVFVVIMSCVFISSVCWGQENVTTVGFQVKPMIDTKFVDQGGGESSFEWLDAKFSAEGGYSMGMVIRRGFTPSISIETGISYLKRNYKVEVLDTDSLYEGTMEYSLISYQIPIQGLVYARLTENLWMNASGGLGVNFMPSDVKTNTFEYRQTTYRAGNPNWVRASLMANYGFEYRTKKSGFYYLGVSYDRPIEDLALSRATIKRPDGPEQSTIGTFTGAYFTVDLRYFFHEDPERKKRKPSRR